ncbi:hypothetical protein Tco_0053378 [Tanacetum coccineum]
MSRLVRSWDLSQLNKFTNVSLIRIVRAQVVKKKQAGLSRQEVTGKGCLTVAPDSLSTTPIAERIDKLERQILDGKLMFVDDDGKSLYKADSMVNADSDSEVEEVFNETVGFVISISLKSGSESGYGTKSLLEQWSE